MEWLATYLLRKGHFLFLGIWTCGRQTGMFFNTEIFDFYMLIVKFLYFACYRSVEGGYSPHRASHHTAGDYHPSSSHQPHPSTHHHPSATHHHPPSTRQHQHTRMLSDDTDNSPDGDDSLNEYIQRLENLQVRLGKG